MNARFTMEDDPAVPAGRASVTVAVFAFLIAVAIPLQGQTPQSVPPDIMNGERVRQQEMSKREWQLRNLASEPEKAARDSRHVQAVIEQVEQDFKRILTLHNEFARRLSANKSLDYNFLSDAAGEIQKRSSRIQTNLALSKPNGNEQDQLRRLVFDETEIRGAVILLCRHIESFIKNPIIATPGTVDAQQLTKARRDLEEIIQRSDDIRKSVVKLKKNVP